MASRGEQYLGATSGVLIPVEVRLKGTGGSYGSILESPVQVRQLRILCVVALPSLLRSANPL